MTVWGTHVYETPKYAGLNGCTYPGSCFDSFIRSGMEHRRRRHSHYHHHRQNHVHLITIIIVIMISVAVVIAAVAATVVIILLPSSVLSLM